MMKKSMLQKKQRIKLYNTYLTDLKKMGVRVSIKHSKKDVRLYTRTYVKGYVFFQEKRLDAEFIQFRSGNVRVRSVSGEYSEMFLTSLNEYFETQGYLPMIRQFYLYLYPLVSPWLSGAMIYFFCYQRYGIVLMMFVVMAIVRYMYEFARNVY